MTEDCYDNDQNTAIKKKKKMKKKKKKIQDQNQRKATKKRD